MKTVKKELYETPETLIVEHNIEGVICISGLNGQMVNPDDYEHEDDPFNF